MDASKAGECSRCGNYLPLDDQGLCPACQGRPPCQNHPERGAVGRCKGCKNTFCRACMPQRMCHACAESAPPEPRKKKGPGTGALPEVAAEPKAKRKFSPTQMLVALVSVLVLINAGLFVWRMMDTPSSTPEERMVQKLSLVRSAVRNFKVEKDRNPKDAAEVQKFLQEAGLDVKVVGSEAEAGPGVVIFRPKGRSYEVYAKGEDGQIFRRPPARGR